MTEPTIESGVELKGDPLPDEFLAAVDAIDDGEETPETIYTPEQDSETPGDDDSTGNDDVHRDDVDENVTPEIDRSSDDTSGDTGEPADGRLGSLQGIAKKYYNTSDEWLADKTADQIEAALLEVDRQRGNQQSHRPQQQRPAPQPKVEGELSEYEQQLEDRGYDLDDPLVKSHVEMQQQNAKLAQDLNDVRGHIIGERENKVKAEYNAAFHQELVAQNLPVAFGEDGQGTAAQMASAKHVYNRVLRVHAETQWDLRQCMASVIRSDFQNELKAQRGDKRFSEASKQGRTRLGSGSRSPAPVQGSGNTADSDYEVELDSDLASAHSRMVRENG